MSSSKCVKTNHICPPFDCGNGLKLGYPFWALNESDPFANGSKSCGYKDLGVFCEGQLPILSFPNGISYSVKNISYSERTFTIVSQDVIANKYITCPCPRHNFTIKWSNTLSYSNLHWFVGFFYNCSSSSPLLPDFFIKKPMLCLDHETKNTKHSYWALLVYNYKYHYDSGNCEDYVQLPTISTINSTGDNNYTGILQEGIILEWQPTDFCNTCESSGGFCTSDGCCICSHGFVSCSGDPTGDCSSSSNSSSGSSTGSSTTSERPKLLIGTSTTSKREKILIGTLVPLMALVTVMLLFVYRKKLIVCILFSLCIKMDNTPHVEMFLESYGSQVPRRYTFSDIKKMTNSFIDKLGQGGFGGVFKGKLLDGRLVAVKLLNEAKGEEGEDFINEVATIGRTNHLNVVSLVGYCSEGSKRALIYEFMPNGSLEKFIYAKEQGGVPSLGWEKLYQIALGIARGLEYLHLRCNIRILHFDIKPHNILLDQDFCPKISDFGLAKLCPTRDSIVSMVGARGTTGYIAPEVYCRSFGGVSYKSDVYSYGMMLLEMVGGRKNIDATVENISEIYFPQWIYKKLQQEDEGLRGFEEIVEDEMARKLVLVGLWCIQTDQAMRPSMSRVLEMLEGNIEDLQVPPNPFMNST